MNKLEPITNSTLRQYLFRATSITLDSILAALANEQPYHTTDGIVVNLIAVNSHYSVNNVAHEVRIVIDTSNSNTTTLRTVSSVSTTLSCVFGLTYESSEILAVTNMPSKQLYNIMRCLRANTQLRSVYSDTRGRTLFDIGDVNVGVAVLGSYSLLVEGECIAGLICPPDL